MLKTFVVCLIFQGPENDSGFWPANGKMFYAVYKLSRNDAFEKAIELVLKNPKRNICEIYQREEEVFTLKCFEASDVEKMEFRESPGYHVLFYSNTEFIWKEQVPVKQKCDDITTGDVMVK